MVSANGSSFFVPFSTCAVRPGVSGLAYLPANLSGPHSLRVIHPLRGDQSLRTSVARTNRRSNNPPSRHSTDTPVSATMPTRLLAIRLSSLARERLHLASADLHRSGEGAGEQERTVEQHLVSIDSRPEDRLERRAGLSARHPIQVSTHSRSEDWLQLSAAVYAFRRSVRNMSLELLNCLARRCPSARKGCP